MGDCAQIVPVTIGIGGELYPLNRVELLRRFNEIAFAHDVVALEHAPPALASSGALHVAVEHSQAILALVEEKLFASALALVRPLFESYLRGTWLLNAASEAQIDDTAGPFPGRRGHRRRSRKGGAVTNARKTAVVEDAVQLHAHRLSADRCAADVRRVGLEVRRTRKLRWR
jgi:hypothetical protein